MSVQELAMLEALFAQTPIGLGMIDCELRFVRVNDALARMNGLAPEDHPGHTMVELFGELGAPTQALLQRVLETGEPLVDEEISGPVPWNGGEIRHYRATYTPVHDESGRALGVTALVADVTDRRRDELERERSLERERRAADRTTRLQWVTAALSSSMTEREVAEVLVREAAAAVGADRAWVSLVSDDQEEIDVAASVGFPVGTVERFGHLGTREARPGADAIRDGQARFFASAREQAAAYPSLAPAYCDAGNEAGAVVPIPSGRGLVGFIAVAFSEEHAFSEEDRSLLSTIARQCGQAFDRAAIYEREHATALALAQSLLPESLPDIPGIDLAARYRPAPGIGAAVGGDFYDAFESAGGSWILVVGDVCGKGPEAAALTALVRYTLRAEALRGAPPAELLRRINEAILAQRSDGRFCTIACARAYLDPHGADVAVAAAGHPPPFVVGERGEPRLVEARGSLLGVMEEVELDEARLRLAPGDTFVAYTDGLLEAHAPEHVLTPTDLAREAARAAGGDPSTLVAALHHAAVSGGDAPPRDDVAILAARVARAAA
jgi:PAS domain S-box-containing protein